MGVQDLQAYLEGGTIQGSCSNVDLVRIAKSMSARLVKQSQKKGGNHAPNQFSLVVDGECCLDRLYGGYFSDWACGGQWNRMVMFLSQFVNSLKKANIDLIVFFNGCIEPQRMNEWIQQQQRTRLKVNQVLRHMATKGTPPPKVWWTAPVCLRTAVRMVLRHLEVTVMCTMDDHRQEVIAYCRENQLHGLLADDAEYAAFQPPRYFSARHLKLTYKGSLETKEYNLHDLNKELGLSTEKLCILVALLGNYILGEADLIDIYKKQGINQPLGKIPGDVLVEKMAAFVKSLPAGENLADTCATILGSDKDPRLPKLKQSIQYYLDGTKEGFLDYRAANTVEHMFHDVLTTRAAVKAEIKEIVLNGTRKPDFYETFHIFLERYSLNSHWYLIEEESDYRVWKGLLILWLSLTATLIWNFIDLFIMLISAALAAQFSIVNKTLRKIRGRVLTEAQWREYREMYANMTHLVKTVDNHINKIIAVSVANNIYFICAQLITEIDSIKQDYIPSIFYLYSFLFLVARTTAVVIQAAAVHDESLKVTPELFKCPYESYCIEVQRFLQEVTSDHVSLTGLNMFSITRNFLLGIAGAILTYEIVLIQLQNTK